MTNDVAPGSYVCWAWKGEKITKKTGGWKGKTKDGAWKQCFDAEGESREGRISKREPDYERDRATLHRAIRPCQHFVHRLAHPFHPCGLFSTEENLSPSFVPIVLSSEYIGYRNVFQIIATSFRSQFEFRMISVFTLRTDLLRSSRYGVTNFRYLCTLLNYVAILSGRLRVY